MIRKGKWHNALAALNSVLVVARAMAYERRNHEELANVLDVGEYLPLLIAGPNDETDFFRATIVGLVAIDERFNMAVEKFDGTEFAWRATKAVEGRCR